MEQIRHGRDTWAQFDNEEDNKFPRNNQHENCLTISNTYGSTKVNPVWVPTSIINSSVSTNKSHDVQSKFMTVHSSNTLPRNHQVPTKWNQTPSDTHSYNPTCVSNSTPVQPDPWAVTSEQRAYYLAQFLRLQPDPRSKLDGLQSKPFFELSHLPVDDLSRIWELADIDQDGQLTLGEFCAAMHLVVLRRNGIPIPHVLPQPLVDLITINHYSSSSSSTLGSNSNKLRSKLEKQTSEPTPPSPSGLSNSSESGQAPTAVDGDMAPNHKSVSSHGPNSIEHKQQQQRRWSISSQSDVCSLAEGMLIFESRPNSDVQLKHPIPLRVRPIAPASNYVHPSCDINAAQPYPFPNAFPAHAANQWSNDRLAVRLRSDMSGCAKPGQPSPKKISAPAGVPPPPPPPRQHVNLDHPGAGGLKSANLRAATFVDGVIQNHYSQDLSPSTVSASLSKASYTPMEQHLDKQKVTELRNQCDAVVQVNEQLANELMKLQKDRIALKLLLERLMPLDAA